MVLDPVTFKYTMGILSVILALVAYGIYGWQTLNGQTRPHPLSWLIFGVLTGTGFLVQWDQAAGAGSWAMAVTAIICFVLCIVGVWKGERKFPWFEWAFLFSAGFVFLFYVCSKKPNALGIVIMAIADILGYDRSLSTRLVTAYTDFLTQYGPAVSAILATAVDVVGYGPTITKAWARPHTDSATSFALNSVKFVPSLLAMNSVSVATCTYPATLVVVNAAVAILLIWRRHQLVNVSANGTLS